MPVIPQPVPVSHPGGPIVRAIASRAGRVRVMVLSTVQVATEVGSPGYAFMVEDGTVPMTARCNLPPGSYTITES